MSEKKAVGSVALASGLLGLTMGLNWYFKCAPEERPLQFLLRMTTVACITQFVHARALVRIVNDKKGVRKSATKGGRFGEILSIIARTCAWYGAGVFAFHIAAVLFGAPLFENFYGTFLWAALLSALTFLPVGIVTDENSPEWMFMEKFVLLVSV